MMLSTETVLILGPMVVNIQVTGTKASAVAMEVAHTLMAVNTKDNSRTT
jgi:hypothetical protein